MLRNVFSKLFNMAPPVEPTQANFYTAKDFGGDKYEYQVGADVSVPGELNDKFHSVNVGVNAKVIAWQHYNSTGIYKEWTGAVSSIDDIEGLSRFQVVDGDTRAISFLFKDDTGGKAKQYSLKLDARDVGSVTLYSNDGDQYRLVGIMPEDSLPVTTALYLRDENSGSYLSVGSVFFQWDASNNGVKIVENDNWPKQLKSEQKGPSSFLITLIDNTPSE